MPDEYILRETPFERVLLVNVETQTVIASRPQKCVRWLREVLAEIESIVLLKRTRAVKRES